MSNQEKIHESKRCCLVGSLSTWRWQVRTCSTEGQLLVLCNLFSRSFTKLLTPMLSSDSRVGSWAPLYYHLGWICFLRGVTRWASQLAATRISVKSHCFNSLTRLAKTDTMGILASTSCSTQVPLYSRSRSTKGGSLGSWFSQ
jgi:hypothetical protein